MLYIEITIVLKRHGNGFSGLPVLEVSPDVVDLISHAVEQRLRPILEKLSVVTEHRVEMYRVRNYSATYVELILAV